MHTLTQHHQVFYNCTNFTKIFLQYGKKISGIPFHVIMTYKQRTSLAAKREMSQMTAVRLSLN